MLPPHWVLSYSTKLHNCKFEGLYIRVPNIVCGPQGGLVKLSVSMVWLTSVPIQVSYREQAQSYYEAGNEFISLVFHEQKGKKQ